jgi:GT2 family glycosyltransferase/glycosyltransferase involved in cell wall biosynthesis/2-polyprenyl-3-methyl-5-hydroxy-6-metoxy-1,4-benzoquinol methylase
MSKYDVTVDLTRDTSSSLILRSVKPGSMVLEFGPATGYMTDYMTNSLQCDVYCVELDANAAKEASKFAQGMVVGDIESFKWYDEYRTLKFDYIIFADVLEHLRDPWEVLRRSTDLLRDTGHVLASIPNFGHNVILMNLFHGKFQYLNLGLLDNTHIRFFTRESMQNMFNYAGLDVLSLTGTILSPEDTEFGVSYAAIPTALRKELLTRQDAHVYQYVSVLRKRARLVGEPTVTPTDIRDLGFVDRDFISVRTLDSQIPQYETNLVYETTQHIDLNLDSELYVPTLVTLKCGPVLVEIVSITLSGQLNDADTQRVLSHKEISMVVVPYARCSILSNSDGNFGVFSWGYDSEVLVQNAFLQFGFTHPASMRITFRVKKSAVSEQIQRLAISEKAARDQLNRERAAIRNLQGVSQELSIERNTVKDLQGRYEIIEQELRQTRQNLLEHQQSHTRLREELGIVYSTLSWRLTRPLRLATAWRRKLFRRKRNHMQLVPHMQSTQGSMVDQRSGIQFSFMVPRPIMVLDHHNENVDIVICVHNALADVKRCLESVVGCTTQPFNIILVDDGSSEDTASYLQEFSRSHGAELIRNENALGYTFSANIGLKHSNGEYVVLLNSDTIVTDGWIDRMVACFRSDTSIGVVGPLSNTASWQSVPEIESGGDWSDNPLPTSVTVTDMGRMIARYSARMYPELKFLNGFCFMMRRNVLQEIGYFDEENFGRGYGEENDYSLRVRAAGLKLAVCDDVYVFHAQSKSYSHERRKQLSDYAGQVLEAKHGKTAVEQGVAFCRQSEPMQGIRLRTKVMFERDTLVAEGKRRWDGKSLLFVLPVMDAGGGGNVIIQEANAMREMGVRVTIANLAKHRHEFESGYPAEQMVHPVIYFEDPAELRNVAMDFDVVVATANYSVVWLRNLPSSTKCAYYVQDFEPLFYQASTEEYQQALESYTAIAAMRLVTKTRWNYHCVKEATGVECSVVGPSVDIDLFRPRPRYAGGGGVITLSAMIRPSSPRRSPHLTMEVLAAIKHTHQDNVRIVVFGCDDTEMIANSLRIDFDFKNLGKLTRYQLAGVLSETDVFVDLSTYQAMGLTAMEAMACGAAVVVPKNGGTTEYAMDKHNALVVDTNSSNDCYEAIDLLVRDHGMRDSIKLNAQRDAVQYFPERAAFRALETILQN